MSLELIALLGVTLVLFVAILVQQIGIDRAYGATFALSNRDSLPAEASPTVERLTRLVRNHVEGLVLFSALVLVGAVAGVSNRFTQYAALAILAMRLLHFVSYAFGVTPLRSFAWGIGYMVAMPVFIYGLISGSF